MKKRIKQTLTLLSVCAAVSLSAALSGTHSVYAKLPEEEELIEGTTNGKDYIEVSISEQRVRHYVKGKLHCEADCVTGTAGSRDTPRGTFHIKEMTPGRKLQPKGSTTPVWVDRWMCITSDGVGLHDAQWRSAFGGNIYTYHGSHGCINLPKDFAFQLYDEVHRGYTVVVRD